MEKAAIIDLRGLECPDPVFRAIKLLRDGRVKPGARILVEQRQCAVLIAAAVEAHFSGKASVRVVEENPGFAVIVE